MVIMEPVVYAHSTESEAPGARARGDALGCPGAPDQPASPSRRRSHGDGTVVSRRYFTSESLDFKLEGGAYLSISPVVFLHKLQED